ncbi:MAG: OsmC family protein [Anaerolineaceae bacterium]|nr:OsmC family protein [Anaerolineaceae bacterium]
MNAKVTWKGNLSFSGIAETGFTVPLGADVAVGGDDDGFRPIELFLVALAGCTSMDVISILSKKRQPVSSFEVAVEAERSTEHPRVFTHITLEYIVKGRGVDRAAVERAVELSTHKYCPAQTMLSQVVPIKQIITIQED